MESLDTSQPWVIVLAGGEGKRMCPFAKFCFGEARPKQYCAFCEEGTLLSQTLERACPLTDPSRVLIVIGRGHERYLAAPECGTVLRQPEARGTAVGVFWPLSLIVDKNPDETVLILPSDHFIFPQERTLEMLRSVCRLAKVFHERVILAGVRPESPEPEYGWILPVSSSSFSELPSEVAGFSEKPTVEAAQDCFRQGGLWNTMITAASLGTLWRLAEQVLPELVGALEKLRDSSIATSDDGLAWDAFIEAYSDLPESDFSRDFLTRIPGSLLVLPMEGLLWSDWGRPERVKASLARLELEFPDRWRPERYSRLKVALDAWEKGGTIT